MDWVEFDYTMIVVECRKTKPVRYTDHHIHCIGRPDECTSVSYVHCDLINNEGKREYSEYHKKIEDYRKSFYQSYFRYTQRIFF